MVGRTPHLPSGKSYPVFIRIFQSPARLQVQRLMAYCTHLVNFSPPCYMQPTCQISHYTHGPLGYTCTCTRCATTASLLIMVRFLNIGRLRNTFETKHKFFLNQRDGQTGTQIKANIIMSIK